MEAPIVWFLFQSTVAQAIERNGSYEKAIIELSQNSDESHSAELVSYFDAASSATEEDCRLIVASRAKNSIYVVPEGQTCREMYTWIKRVFVSARSK